MDPQARVRARRRPAAGLIVAVAAVAAALIATPAQAAKDRNHDRIPDRWEKKNDLSLKHDQAKRDQDRDGLANRGEFEAGLDPRDADTDNDGVEDGDEGAGTIVSFNADTGELTIDLFNGGDLTGTVTGDTEIKCEDEADDDEAGDDGDRSGSNSGPGRRSHGGDDGDRNCGVADLVRGAVVSEAELEANGQGAIFEEIELR
ncbi:MAG: hypothetical protein ACJ75R_08475 [Solirubrobacterales bacterium]